MLQKVKKRGASLKLLGGCATDLRTDFRYAVATGKAVRDPTPDLKEALSPCGPKNEPKGSGIEPAC